MLFGENDDPLLKHDALGHAGSSMVATHKGIDNRTTGCYSLQDRELVLGQCCSMSSKVVCSPAAILVIFEVILEVNASSEMARK